MNPHYPAVAERAAHRCEYCRAPEVFFNWPFEVEHIMPPGKGGAEDDTNRALACRACNVFKSDHVDGLDVDTQMTVPLYHPRLDRWDDHFRVDRQRGTILGLTAIGRATIARLRMNSSAQTSARQQWIRLGLFP